MTISASTLPTVTDATCSALASHTLQTCLLVSQPRRSYQSATVPLPLNEIGGKGTPRRKQAPKAKGPGGEDPKLQAALKKLQVEPVSGIEEVNMFKEDGNVLHFNNPRGELEVGV